MAQSQSDSEPALSDEELSDLADTLASDSGFFDDVIETGLYEAIVEGDHGYAVDHASAELLIEELVYALGDALEEY